MFVGSCSCPNSDVSSLWLGSQTQPSFLQKQPFTQTPLRIWLFSFVFTKVLLVVGSRGESECQREVWREMEFSCHQKCPLDSFQWPLKRKTEIELLELSVGPLRLWSGRQLLESPVGATPRYLLHYYSNPWNHTASRIGGFRQCFSKSGPSSTLEFVRNANSLAHSKNQKF